MNNMRIKITAMGLLILACSLVQSLQAQSPFDGFAPFLPGSSEGASGLAVAVQPDGKVLFGGGFVASPSSRKNLTRLLPDGSLDVAFNANVTGIGSNSSSVGAIVLQPDGKILIAGGFSFVQGVPRSGFARLNANGTLDSTFNPNTVGLAALALQQDGKILIGGFFTSVQGVARNGLARLNANGTLDVAFNPGGSATQVTAITVQKDSRILVGGSFTNIGGQLRNNIARLETNGNADITFNPNANGSVGIITIQSNSRIVISGDFTDVGGISRNKLARLMPNGMGDISFTAPSIVGDITHPAVIRAIRLQLDGQVLLGGDFVSVGGQPQRSLARLNQDGSHDTTYSPVLAGGNFRTTVNSIAIQQDGKSVITGEFYVVNGESRVNGARLERDGRIDRTLENGLSRAAGLPFVYAISVQANGKILVGGLFDDAFGQPRLNIARLENDGSLDFAFNASADDTVSAIIVQLDGKIVIGGTFTNVDGQARNRIARLNSDGTLDSTFIVNLDSTVSALALQQDGKILVGGNFQSVDGMTRNRIARLNPDGTLDSFDPDAGGFDVSTISVQPDGKILVGGFFSFIGGEFRGNIARLNTDGTADSFDPNADGEVKDIAILANGKIMIGGSFGTLTPNGGSSLARVGLARLNADGTVDMAFGNPNVNGQVDSIVAQSDGKVIVGGQFTLIAGQMRNRIARLNLDGTADSFDANANNPVLSLAIQTDGKILVGGVFTQIGGQTRNAFARLLNNTAVSQRLSVFRFGIAWSTTGPSSYHPITCFQYSTNYGTTWGILGCSTGTSSFPRPASGKSAASPVGGTPSDVEYTLTGLNLPTQQNLLVRVQAFTSNLGSFDEYAEDVYLLAPTAASVSISGRVRTSNGRGLLNATVSLTDNEGITRTTRTKSFGYFRFAKI
jgi:uncharacterized delta-60 repeat protein